MMEDITVCAQCFPNDGGVYRGGEECPNCGEELISIGFVESADPDE